jgi:site-specific DNA recombinase
LLTFKIEPLLKKGRAMPFKLDSIYETCGIEKKRALIGSMFPEKMTFDGSTLRPGRVNEAAQFIYRIQSELQPQKKRTRKENFHLSAGEVSSGFEPL